MKGQQYLKVCLTTIAVGLTILVSQPTRAEILVGLSYPSLGGGENQVFTIDSSAPGAILQTHPLTGLGASETLRGLDFYADGNLYGLGSGANLYKVDYTTGACTLVGYFGVPLNGASFGVDNMPAGYSVVSELGQNLMVNRLTGAATVLPTTSQAGGGIPYLTATAYKAANSTLYAIDSLANTLGILNPLTGVFTTIGLMGFDVARNNGFDIDGAGVAFLASGATSSDVQANLYTVNLATGQALLVGLIGQPGDDTLVRGLTVIPEPGTAALLLGGFGLLALAMRRRE